MAGNLEVTDLPLIPAVDGADVYAAKNNLDYRVRTGEAGGLATLDGAGKVNVAQLPPLDYLPLTGGTLTGNVFFQSGTPLFITGRNTGTVLNTNLLFSVNGGDATTTTAGISYVATENWTGSAKGTNVTLTATPNGSLVSTTVATLAPGGSVINSDLALVNNAAGNVPRLMINSTGVTGVNGLEFRSGGTFKGGLFHDKSTDNVDIFTAADGTNSRIRVFNNGLVSVGTNTSPPSPVKLWVIGGSIRSEGGSAGMEWIEQGGTTRWVWYAAGGTALLFNSVAATNVVTVTNGGIVSATNFVATSDANLKEQITDRKARDRLPDLLRFVDFIWKANGEASLGLIAQEVREIAPEYVNESRGKDGEVLLAIDKASLALECVIGLAARVRELEAK